MAQNTIAMKRLELRTSSGAGPCSSRALRANRKAMAEDIVAMGTGRLGTIAEYT